MDRPDRMFLNYFCGVYDLAEEKTRKCRQFNFSLKLCKSHIFVAYFFLTDLTLYFHDIYDIYMVRSNIFVNLP